MRVPTVPAPTISVGRPVTRRERTTCWAVIAPMRAVPTPTSPSAHRCPRIESSSESPLTYTATIATPIAATETALATGPTPSMMFTRIRRSYMPRTNSVAIASSGKRRIGQACSTGTGSPGQLIVTARAASSATKSVIGRTKVQPRPSKSHADRLGRGWMKPAGSPAACDAAGFSGVTVAGAADCRVISMPFMAGGVWGSVHSLIDRSASGLEFLAGTGDKSPSAERGEDECEGAQRCEQERAAADW